MSTVVRWGHAAAAAGSRPGPAELGHRHAVALVDAVATEYESCGAGEDAGVDGSS